MILEGHLEDLLSFVLNRADMKLNEIVAEKLKDHRLAKRMTQEQMADILSVERTTYGKIERGERDLSLDMIEQYATTLGIDKYSLLGATSVYIDSGNNTNGDFSAHGINTTLNLNIPKRVIEEFIERFFPKK